MRVLGIRGAITVDNNCSDDILERTGELLKEMILRNDIDNKDVASIFFTCTKDLNAVYPAVAARQLGFSMTALFCCQEMEVIGSLPMCIRILMHVNSSSLCQERVKHVYLRGAVALRKDLIGEK